MPGTLPPLKTGPEPASLPGWRVPRAIPGALPRCSLVIPTYGRPRETAELLAALARLPDVPGEVLVVDGSSSMETAELLAGWPAHAPLPFDLVYARAPRGLTRQRNAGIDLSSGDYVFFLDDDALPQPGYFASIRNVFDRHPGAGAVGGVIVNHIARPLNRRWRLRYALRLAPNVEPGIYHASGTSTPRALMRPFSGVRRVDLLPGCAFAFRRAVLDECRFSEFFDGYSQGEDMEMCLRVGRRWELLVCGNAGVVHNTAAAGRPGSFAKGRMEVRNRYFIWKRHAPHAAAADRARFWADLWFLLSLDAAAFCVRPWRRGPLAHGAGILSGIAGCLLRPPRYEEPRARRRYRGIMAGEAVPSPRIFRPAVLVGGERH